MTHAAAAVLLSWRRTFRGVCQRHRGSPSFWFALAAVCVGSHVRPENPRLELTSCFYVLCQYYCKSPASRRELRLPTFQLVFAKKTYVFLYLRIVLSCENNPSLHCLQFVGGLAQIHLNTAFYLSLIFSDDGCFTSCFFVALLCVFCQLQSEGGQLPLLFIRPVSHLFRTAVGVR